jgi:hypothetical protein
MIETSPLLTLKIKLVNFSTTLSMILSVIICIYIFSDLRMVLPILGLISILLMEINNTQLPKGHQLE